MDRARRVGFVTCAAWPDIPESGRYVAGALAARGIAVDAVPWNHPDARLDGLGAAVFRVETSSSAGPTSA